MAATGLCLCQHGRGPAAALAALADLGDLGLGQQGDVPGQLAGHRGGTSRGGGGLDQPQPAGVPGQRRCGQPEFLGQQPGHPRPGLAERGQRPGGPAELHGQPGGRDPGQVLDRLVKPGQPARRDQPERHRHGLLQQRPADHDRLVVLRGQGGGGVRGTGQVGQDRGQRLPGEQHRGGVQDVLAGRPGVHGAGGRPVHQAAQLADQGGHRVAGTGGGLPQRVEVEQAGVGGRGHRRTRPGGGHPGPLGRPGQRGLGVEHGLQPGGIPGPRSPGPEQPAEQPATVSHRHAPSQSAVPQPSPPPALAATGTRRHGPFFSPRALATTGTRHHGPAACPPSRFFRA